ncbi:MAG: homoserine kinase [Tumebacillaceae bacterium]
MRVRVRVPATTANMGPGFDVIGMALSLYNEVEMEEISDGLVISVEGEGIGQIDLDEQNMVYQAAQEVFARVGYRPKGLRIHLKNSIPVTRGLGSSSAALVGGLVAANKISGNRLDQQALLELATELEGHPDNVVPALLGGIVLSGKIRGQWRTIRIEPPIGLRAVVAIPEFELSTKVAREVLPEQVSREDAIFTSSHVGVMVAALMQGDLELFGACLEDRLHQPYRESLIPGMSDVILGAEQAGALGVAISGAGPTMIAFTDGRLAMVGEAMKSAFAAHKIACRVQELAPDSQGIYVGLPVA